MKFKINKKCLHNVSVLTEIMSLFVVMLTVRPVRYTDQNAFSTSHFHISNAVVEKASAEEVVCCFNAF